jgi:hypothetical protein
MGGEGSVLYSL